MKGVIRSKLTQQFLQPGGTWTKDHANALDFPHMRSAIAARKELKLKHVEIVLMLGNYPSPYDVILPLQRDR